MRRNADDGECGWAARSGVVDKTRGLEERCERNRYSPSTISRCLAESQTCRENPKYEGKRSQRPLVCIPCTIQSIRGGQAAICSVFFVSVCSVIWQVPPACQVVGAYYIQGVPEKVPFEIHL